MRGDVEAGPRQMAGSACASACRARSTAKWAAMTVRVLLAEDQAMVRGALAALLALEEDIEIVAEASRGDEVLPAALEPGRTWRCST